MEDITTPTGTNAPEGQPSTEGGSNLFNSLFKAKINPVFAFAFIALSAIFAGSLTLGFYNMPEAVAVANEVSFKTQGEVLGETTGGFYPYPTGTLVNDSGTIYFISGTSKIPFANWKAYSGLGYAGKEVVEGDLTNYDSANNYSISTPDIAHPWGSWLIYKGTVYYSGEDGLVGVPSAKVFTSNGGDWKYIVKANSYDVTILQSNPNLPLLTLNDSRISFKISDTSGGGSGSNGGSGGGSGSGSTDVSLKARVGQLVFKGSGTVYLVGDNGLIGIPNMEVFNSWCFTFADMKEANKAEKALSQTGVLELRQSGQTLSNGVSKLLVTTCKNETGSLRMVSPNGGERWSKGTTQVIKWEDNRPMPTCAADSASQSSAPTCLAPEHTYDLWLSCSGPACALSNQLITQNIRVNSYSWYVSVLGDYKMTVCDAGSMSVCDSSDASFSISDKKDVSILTSKLPDATIGQPYSTELKVEGGTAPYKWSPISTTYPSGCCILGISGEGPVFNTQTGSVVSDTYPAGNYSWVIQVIDSAGNKAEKTVYLTIKSAQGALISVSPSSLNFNVVSGASANSQTVEVASSIGSISGVDQNALLMIQVSSESLSWLRVARNGTEQGSTLLSFPANGTFYVSVNTASLAAGTYNGYININNITSNVPEAHVSIPVTLIVGGNSLSVVSPNAGDVWKVGASQTVKWNYSGTFSKLKIMLKDSRTPAISAIYDGTMHAVGQVSWQVPSTVTPGTAYSLSLIGYDSSNNILATANSGTFTIIEPPLVMGVFTQVDLSAPLINGPNVLKAGVNNTFSGYSVDAKNGLVSYLIDWGDGTSDYRLNFSSGKAFTVSHAYKTSGQYDVLFNAVNADGVSKTNVFRVVVK